MVQPSPASRRPPRRHRLDWWWAHQPYNVMTSHGKKKKQQQMRVLWIGLSFLGLWMVILCSMHRSLNDSGKRQRSVHQRFGAPHARYNVRTNQQHQPHQDPTTLMRRSTVGLVGSSEQDQLVAPQHDILFLQPQETNRFAHLQSLESQYAAASFQAVNEMSSMHPLLTELVDAMERQMVENLESSDIQWTPPDHLPPLPGDADDKAQQLRLLKAQEVIRNIDAMNYKSPFVWAHRDPNGTMAWQDEWKRVQLEQNSSQSTNYYYTSPGRHRYPDVHLEQPPPIHGEYPSLQPLKELLERWPQNQVDRDDHAVMEETLLRFNFSDPRQRAASMQYRDYELPFVLYNVPEVDAASSKWMDEDYLSHDSLQGVTVESTSHWFCDYDRWDVHTLGLPPHRHNDWTYSEFVEHAKYADAVKLSPDRPHVSYQAPAPHKIKAGETPSNETSFIDRDLPSFVRPTRNETTYFDFDPEALEDETGCQCRFEERGVVQSLHSDVARHWIVALRGVQRWILSPPLECDKLGVFSHPYSPLDRHSALNVDHIRYLQDASAGMSSKERAWLERAATSRSVETVLKTGEVLYIPTSWFRMSVSLGQSAQCSCRAGVATMGLREFGNRRDADACGQDWTKP